MSDMAPTRGPKGWSRMLLQVLRALFLFALVLWLAHSVFGPGSGRLGPRARGENRLFEKDLDARLRAGQLVVVDKTESDRFIHEDLSTHDLTKALTFARLKSEVLEQPLFIENEDTYGVDDKVAQVNPTDRKAWQELTLLELDLKDEFARTHPQDLQGYLDEGALDPQRTPQAMIEFIDRYPDSNLVSTALAHLEYTLCVARKDPRAAMALYRDLGERHKDQAYLVGLLPEYNDRAVEYLQHYRQQAGQ